MFEYPGIEGGLVLRMTMILWSNGNLLSFSSGLTLDFFLLQLVCHIGFFIFYFLFLLFVYLFSLWLILGYQTLENDRIIRGG